MPLISMANVACGFHGSDPNHMPATVRLAKTHDVRVGAHPSLPDRQGFGRRAMDISREELANIIIYQVGALAGFLKAEGMGLNHIKPHGALYGMAARNEEIAHAVCDAADIFGVPVLGMKHTLHEQIYTERGHAFIAEFYADLEYNDDGSLIITRERDPIDPGMAAERCLRAIEEGTTTSTNGVTVEVGSGLHLRALGYPERDRSRAGRAPGDPASSRRACLTCSACGTWAFASEPLQDRSDTDFDEIRYQDRISRPRSKSMANRQILSPLPGTFYRRPEPDQPPYKEEGDPIAVGDVIGLVEVMKSFHEIKADSAGTVTKFLIDNEEAVMAGQPLIEIEG